MIIIMDLWVYENYLKLNLSILKEKENVFR